MTVWIKFAFCDTEFSHTVQIQERVYVCVCVGGGGSILYTSKRLEVIYLRFGSCTLAVSACHKAQRQADRSRRGRLFKETISLQQLHKLESFL